MSLRTRPWTFISMTIFFTVNIFLRLTVNFFFSIFTPIVYIFLLFYGQRLTPLRPKYRSCDNTIENCFFQTSSYSRAYERIIYEKTRIRQRGACVANVSVWFKSKDRLRNRIFGFGRERNETRGHFSRCLWLSFFVLCSEYRTETFATQNWKNKTYKLRRSVNCLNCEVRGETTVFAGVIFNLIILQQTKTVPDYSYG